MWIGNHGRAADLLDESIELARQRGDLFMVGEALHQRGHLAMRRGDYSLATTLLEESLSGLCQVSSKRDIGFPLFRLGLVKHYQGQSEQAIELLQAALVGFRELEDPEGIAIVLGAMGRVLRSTGDRKGAANVYREGLVVSSEVGLKWEMFDCLLGFAVLGVSEERGKRAVRLLAAADALQNTTEVTLAVAEQAEFDQLVKGLRGNLGDEAFAAAWAEGRAMTLEQAIEYALVGETCPEEGHGSSSNVAHR
jgi:tetratricopeptide (TPR) repeat protein